MPVFLLTDNGRLLNLARVDELRKVRRAGATDYIYEPVRYEPDAPANLGTISAYTLEQAVVQLMPPSERWEVLTMDDDDGTIFAVPVVAWALTLSGDVMPVTPDLEVAQGNFALRMNGGEVHQPMVGTWATAEAWRDEKRAGQKSHADAASV